MKTKILLLLIEIPALCAASALFADGSGTEADPYTGDSVMTTMDAGSATTGAYYLIDTSTDFTQSADTLLYIGSANPNNHLTISGGAAVTGGYVDGSTYYYNYVGSDEDSDDNSLTVTGSGTSLALVSNLAVGGSGAGNSMTISSGATVSNVWGSVGEGSTSDASLGCGNSATITGSGSKWTSSSYFYTGRYGGKNTLTVTDGGELATATTAFIGVGYSDRTMGCGNTVIVSDSGTWTASGDLDVGYYGGSNALVVEDGGIVTCATTVNIGYGYSDTSSATNAYGSRNTITVTGSGTLSTAYINIGYLGNYNELRIENGGTLDSSSFDYGNAHVGNGTTSSSGEILGRENRIVVTGTGSTWNLQTTYTNDVYVGYKCGSYNSMVVSDGGALSGKDEYTSYYVGYGFKGYSSYTWCNGMLVTGSDTTVTGRQIRVGDYSDYNALYVLHGATVTLGGSSYFAVGGYTDTSYSTSTAKGNIAVVAGDGTSISVINGGISIDAASSSGNTLTIANGGLVRLYYTNYEALSYGSAARLRLAGGYMAFKGDDNFAYKMTLMLNAGLIEVWDADSSSWVTATSDDLTKVTYADSDDGTAAAKTATANGDFDGYDNLAGYMVYTGGDRCVMDVDWADVQYCANSWFESSYYGWFSTSIECNGWIWNCDHGWQYVYAESTTSGVYIWDDATASWWYTDESVYPLMFQYQVASGVWGGTWYCYVSGSAPDRVYWDYTTDGEISESSL